MISTSALLAKAAPILAAGKFETATGYVPVATAEDALSLAWCGRLRPDVTEAYVVALGHADARVLAYVAEATGADLSWRLSDVDALAESPEQLAAWLEGAAGMAVPA